MRFRLHKNYDLLFEKSRIGTLIPGITISLGINLRGFHYENLSAMLEISVQEDHKKINQINAQNKIAYTYINLLLLLHP